MRRSDCYALEFDPLLPAELGLGVTPSAQGLGTDIRGMKGRVWTDWAVLLVFLLLGSRSVCLAVEAGNEVVVVYNVLYPGSKEVAEHYAKRREVPPAQVIGMELPTGEAMTRKDFVSGMQEPLLKILEERNLFKFGPATNRSPDGRLGDTLFRVLIESRIRYAVLCYGVPLMIVKDATLVEPNTGHMPPEMQRNSGAVDTQLALLPSVEQKLPWTGPLASPFYALTNSANFHPTNGLLMVTRLDGPSKEVARGLVDKAMEAETNGWGGRAYFDVRGLGTNDAYRKGDDWIRGAAAVAQRYGMETVIDEKPETFSPGFPMPNVALYAGWYDQHVSGPFTQPTVDFMPGAFAYHLYSFSAHTVHSTNSWVGTLLQKGATCTMGAVDEPYLLGTPNITTFVHRLTFLGFTFGEAAYAAQGALSWQTTIIGDPLYRPTRIPLETLHRQFLTNKSSMIEWSHLLVLNRNASLGSPPAELIRYIESDSSYRQSALLTEKLGDLYWLKGSFSDAVDTYESALNRNPSPQHRLLLLLKCADKRSVYGPDAKAYAHYETVLKEYPRYPDSLQVYQRMLALARRLRNSAEISRCEREIKRLTPPPEPGK